jgi:hypothetical protein
MRDSIFCIFLIISVFYLNNLQTKEKQWKGTTLPRSMEHSLRNEKENEESLGNMLKKNITRNAQNVTYIAAVSTDPIPWKIKRGESAYLKVFIPPGIDNVYMGMNGVSFAGSQLILMKSYGEKPCHYDPQNLPHPTKSETKSETKSHWNAFGDSRTFRHQRKKKNQTKIQCLYFVFYNEDNKHKYAQLESVGFTYTIYDEAIYLAWLNNKRPSSISPTLNEKTKLNTFESPIKWEHKNGEFINTSSIIPDHTDLDISLQLTINEKDVGKDIEIVSAVSWKDKKGKVHWKQKTPFILSSWKIWNGEFSLLKTWKSIKNTSDNIKIHFLNGMPFPLNKNWDQKDVHYYIGYRIKGDSSFIVSNHSNPLIFHLKPK